MFKKHLLAAAVIAGFAGVSQAAIITPVGVTTTDPTDVAGLVVGNLIDGSGLSGAVLTEADAATVTHAGQVFGDGTNENTYTIADPAQPTLTFDLGGTFNVGQVFIWNYHDIDGFFGSTLSGNGAATAVVSFSNDGGATYSGAVNINPAEAPTTVGTAASSSAHALGNVTADHVRIQLLTHFAGGDRIGLGEVVFSTVPEPASLGLMGLGAVAMLSRKR